VNRYSRLLRPETWFELAARAGNLNKATARAGVVANYLLASHECRRLFLDNIATNSVAIITKGMMPSPGNSGIAVMSRSTLT